MAVIGSTVATLADIAKMPGLSANRQAAINMLVQENPMLDDMLWMEGNLPTGHLTDLVVKLPDVYFRRINEGTPYSKSGTVQITEVAGMMSAWAFYDKKLLQIHGGKAALYRAQNDGTFRESFGQKLADTFMYGNQATDTKSFTGLATRFSDINIGESGSATKDGVCIDGGGVGADNTSIWLVVWGANTVHGFYPPGMPAGFQQFDHGEETVYDANNNPFRALRTEFSWDVGLAVRDWRYVVRIANLDVSNLLAASSNADLVKLMIRAIERIPNVNAGRPVFYMNRTVRTILREQMLAKASSQITFDTVAGRRVMFFNEVPVRLNDRLLNTEAQIV
jgi:hypothetical protein